MQHIDVIIIRQALSHNVFSLKLMINEFNWSGQSQRKHSTVEKK